MYRRISPLLKSKQAIKYRCVHHFVNTFALPLPLQQTSAYIDGQWVETKTRFNVEDPGSGQMLGEVSKCDLSDANAAIDAASIALKSWSSLDVDERGVILMRWYDEIIKHSDELATLITAECGKPMVESLGEVSYGATFIKWMIEEGKRTYGRTLPIAFNKQRMSTIRQPVGVCGLITPWNFPFAMITRKAAPALAAGCTVVIKPAEDTPLSALALARLAQQAGIPDGVINVIPSDRDGSIEIGKTLCESELIRKISFTGSSPVGKILMSQSASTVKKVSLELGGNAPFIVFKDTDIDAAVRGCIAAKFRNTGQTCICANRIYVHKDIYEEFSRKLCEATAKLRIGHGTIRKHSIALINDGAVAKIERMIDDAVDKGAKIPLGGKREKYDTLFFQPTVLTNLNTSMLVAKDEIFGPIAPLFSFENESEVIEAANGTNAGLAAYFYTNSMDRTIRVSESLEFGMVGVNTGNISHTSAPFGGIKESGIGREGGAEGIDEFLETKYINIQFNPNE